MMDKLYIGLEHLRTIVFVVVVVIVEIHNRLLRGFICVASDATDMLTI